MSYGAQAALQYGRQHPTRVRSVALAGVATRRRSSRSTLRGGAGCLGVLMDDCAGETACRAAFPDLRSQLARLLTAFEHGPITFLLWNPSTRATEQVSMSRGVFVERLRLMLYDLGSASQVPRVIHRAAHGDWGPFASASSSGTITGVSGMYMTITCSETMARITEDDIVRESRGTFVASTGRDAIFVLPGVAARGRAPRVLCARQIRRAGVDAVGELDAATPAYLATVAARSLRNSRQILIRNAAHAYGHPCLQGSSPRSWPRRRPASSTSAACRISAARRLSSTRVSSAA